MKKILIALVLVALFTHTLSQDSAGGSSTCQGAACTCQGCPNNGGSVPVNSPIVVSTSATIAPPACATPTVKPPVITPPSVCIPTIDAPCIEVPTLTAPCVVAPPTVDAPTPVIPVVTPPRYTPPTLPPQVPPPTYIPVAPRPPVITLPNAPSSFCDNDEAQSNKFTLSFKYACRPNVALDSCLGEVVWNNVIILSIVPTDNVFHTYSVVVSAGVGKNTLQFAGAGTSDSYGLLIDDVSLVRLGTTQNIVVNGGFESPNTSGAWTIKSDILGWAGIGIEVGFGPNAYGIGSSQLCELDGNRNYEITQTFLFDNQFNLLNNRATCSDPFPERDLTYTLTFDWAIRTVGISNPASSKANVLWNNFVLDSLQYNGANGGVNHASYSVILQSGENTLQFDGTSLDDSYGVTIDNVRLFSAYNSNNLIVNGDFSSPAVGSGFSIIPGGITGWSAARAEVGYSGRYNTNWPAGQVIELDSDSNQRYTQTITISELQYGQLLLQVQQSVGNLQVNSAVNTAVHNAQNSINSQRVQINNAVRGQLSMLGDKFTQYIRNVYQCVDEEIKEVAQNQLVTISQYSCGSSEWIKYFGPSGDLDFDCDACFDDLTTGWCTIISINGKVVNCHDGHQLQISPCSHFEGDKPVPAYGDRIFWKGKHGGSGRVYVTVATSCDC